MVVEDYYMGKLFEEKFPHTPSKPIKNNLKVCHIVHLFILCALGHLSSLQLVQVVNVADMQHIK